MSPRSRRPALPALALAALGAAACEPPPLDTTRVVGPRGTFGEEVYRILHRDHLREDPRRAGGFALARGGLVGALDHLFPADELEATQASLVRLLPLHDDGTTSAATSRLAGAALRLEDDPDALASLATVLARSGYVDRAHEEAMLRRIASYGGYPRLARALVRLGLAHDGLDAAGAPDPAGSDALARLQGALANRLAGLELSDDAERAVVRLVDLALSEDGRLDEATLPPVSIVARDPRGVALLASTRGVPEPFVDRDPADGLADVDARGRFVDARGEPIELAPFADDGGPRRDAEGRALDPASGELTYRYVRLERSLLAGALRDARALIERGVPMKAVRAFEHLLGPRGPDGTHATRDAALLDLSHGAARSLDLAELPDLLELARTLLEAHEGTAAWAALELETQLDVADRFPVALERGATFEDDLFSWIRKVLRAPGLAEALVEVLPQAEIAGIGPAMRRLMEHRKDRVVEADVARGRVFATPVDRGQPDVRGNQSLAQRLLHLIHDTRGASYEPDFAGFSLGFVFRIPDLGEFYMLSMIGEAQVPAAVSVLTGLSRRPTPSELAAFINQDQTFGNPRGNEGLEVKDNDGDTLFAVSASGMEDALRPLVATFHEAGQLPLLFELFELLHLHWASPQGGDYQARDRAAPRYSRLSGLVRFEPMLIESFRAARVLEATQALLAETRPVRSSRGRPAHATLLAAARKVFTKDAALVDRRGRREVEIDGARVTPLSPFDLVRAALGALDRQLDRSAARRADWDDVVEAVTDLFLDTERTGPTSARLVHRRGLPVASLVLGFLEARAVARAADRRAWLDEVLVEDLEAALGGPELPAALDLVRAIDADPELDAVLGELRDDLLDERAGFPALLVALGDGLSAAKDARLGAALVRFLGRELAPDRLHLFTTLRLAERALELDEDARLLELVRRALDPRPGGGIHAYGLGAALRQAHRVDPLSTAPPDAADLAAITGAAGRWLVDEERGLEKFLALVRARGEVAE